ncbi:hypothetical protein HC362_03140 [Streptomyces sp. 891-h]|nr:hypothetical protein HC362_03140 [Streptomyces sp. 891-h]
MRHLGAGLLRKQSPSRPRPGSGDPHPPQERDRCGRTPRRALRWHLHRPGLDGFEPTVTIEYNSQAGDGIFGLGFALDLPSVARCTDVAVPRYDGTATFEDAKLIALPGPVTERVLGDAVHTVSSYARRGTK